MKKINKETIKKVIPYVIILVVVGGLSFYAGTKTTSKKIRTGSGGQFPSMGAPSDRRQGVFPQAGNFVSGSVLSKDGETLTIDVMPSGSRIILFSSSTKVMKSVEGALNDVQVGSPVLISGTANKDGSIIAKSIQIRSESQEMRRR